MTEPYKQHNLETTNTVHLASVEMSMSLSAHTHAYLCLFPCVRLFLLTLMLQPIVKARSKHQVCFVLFSLKNIFYCGVKNPGLA